VPDNDALSVFSGTGLFEGHDPIAQKYAGHQFGGWNPDLGDGRGLLLGEWQDDTGTQWEMHLKGAGKTPYSRFGDGRAVLRSSIREFLGSEALNALGIATTRALGVIGSSEKVYRETVEPGASIIRVSNSHIRFGHFEWFAFSDQHEQLQKLIDYTIKHHYPECKNTPDSVLSFFEQVIKNTAKMIAQWMAYGFVHGVMNTDNMSILGETFDFGPYAFLDKTQMNAVFNHTDENGRYAFDQQPSVGLWNLQRLGQALSAIGDARVLASALQKYSDLYHQYYYDLMNTRLGGTEESRIDSELIDEWVALLTKEQKDFHTEFRVLSSLPLADWKTRKDYFIDAESYSQWCEKISKQTNRNDTERTKQMLSCNPITVARTHHLQAVIDAAYKGDFTMMHSFYAALSSPFEESAQWRQWHEAPDPEIGGVELSCSS